MIVCLINLLILFRKIITKKKANIPLSDEIKTGKTDSENEENSDKEEKQNENEFEIEIKNEKKIDSQPVKKVAKKRTPNEPEPEKPTYVSTRRYDLSQEEEEDNKEDAKLVINLK